MVGKLRAVTLLHCHHTALASSGDFPELVDSLNLVAAACCKDH